MNRTWLWILAILAIGAPCAYMNLSGAKMAAASGQMAMTNQMRQQALVFESMMGDSLGMAGKPDHDALKRMVDQINAGNLPPSESEKAELRRQGVNPALMPKPIPWILAPDKAERSLSLGYDDASESIVILGWGLELEKPVYEHRIPLGNSRR